MQVFKTYFKIMKKQLPSLLIYITVFLTVTAILSFAILRDTGDSGNTAFKSSKVPVIIDNQDENSAFVEGFLSYLEQYVVFKDFGDDEESKRDALFNRKAVYILTIPEGFTEDFYNGREATLIKDTMPDSADATYVDSAINYYLNQARLYIKYNPEITTKELAVRLQNNLDVQVNAEIKDEQKKKTLNSDIFFAYYFNYLGYVAIACFIVGVSTVMFSYNGIDIMRKHYASPVSIKNMNFQLLFANLIFVMCYLVVFITAGILFNPYLISFNGNLLLFIANSAVFTLVVLSISYLIGISVKGKNAIQALASMLSLCLAFLSGMFVPQQFLGKSVLRVASFTPSYWYVKNNNTIMDLTDYSFDSLKDILISMLIQLGFAVAITAICLVVSKRKRMQAN